MLKDLERDLLILRLTIKGFDRDRHLYIQPIYFINKKIKLA
jgi:hypothetical protein